MADQHNDERPGRERRRRERARLVSDAEYVVVDRGLAADWARCSLLDLSLDGAALALHAGELQGGQQIRLRLEGDPGQQGPVEVRAVVMNRRRRTDPNVYGIVFPELSPLEKKQLLRIVITACRHPAPSTG